MQEQPGMSEMLDAATVLNELVRVDFVKFVSVDVRGTETDSASSLGYLVYNGNRREFGTRTFEGSDSYTLDHDVWVAIVKHHPEFAETAQRLGGYYLNGQWTTANGRVGIPLQ